MNLRTYTSTVRKLHTAYTALAAAANTAEFFEAEAMFGAMRAMREAPDALRVQVCRKCNRHGNHPKPGDPYVSVTCSHHDVPRYDIRTGEETDR